MILTKYKIKTKTNHKINRGFKKSILLAFMIPFIFTTGWELSVVASQVVQVNNTIEYKTNYYSQLENYKTFKAKIDEVPYTDSQFKEDLRLFGNMYMQDENITFNHLFGENKGLNSMLQMKYRYADANKTLESIAYNARGLSASEAVKKKSVIDLYEDLKINDKKEKVYYRNGETKKLREIFKIGHSFSQLLIDIPLENRNRDIYSGGDSISTYNNYITFDQIVQLSQKYDGLRGAETKEKDKYYNDHLGIKF